MIADSGERRVFDTGAQRDRQVGKGRMDLLPYRALMEVSKLFEQGAIKYESRNWEKGMPVKEYLDSGARHHAKCMIGENDEPHLVQWCWNALCALDTYIRIKEGTLSGELMDDLPFTKFRLMGDTYLYEKPKVHGPLTEGSEDAGPPDSVAFEFKHTDQCKEFKNTIKKWVPVVGQLYSIFNTPWKVIRMEWTVTVLQCVTTGKVFSVTWSYWKKHTASGNIYLVEGESK